MTASHNWHDLTWPDFSSLPDDTVAILPVAAVEQHGPHLPVGVDSTINAGILARALALVPDDATVLALPMQHAPPARNSEPLFSNIRLRNLPRLLEEVRRFDLDSWLRSGL